MHAIRNGGHAPLNLTIQCLEVGTTLLTHNIILNWGSQIPPPFPYYRLIPCALLYLFIYLYGCHDAACLPVCIASFAVSTPRAWEFRASVCTACGGNHLPSQAPQMLLVLCRSGLLLQGRCSTSSHLRRISWCLEPLLQVASGRRVLTPNTGPRGTEMATPPFPLVHLLRPLMMI